MMWWSRISIKTRLMMAHWLLTVVMASVVGVISMFWFQREEESRLNDFLITEAQRIKSGIESFYEGDMTNNVMSADDLTNYLAQLVNARLNRAVPYKTTLIVFDWSGRVLAKSNDAIDLSLTPVQPKDIVSLTDVRQITTNSSTRKPYRMVTAALAYHNRPFGYFNLGILNTTFTDAVSVYLHTVMIFLLSIVLFFGALGTYFINRIFSSVKTLAATADKISENHLDMRLPVPPGKDEVHLLAATFNRLLARLETDFKFQEDLVNQLSHQMRTPLTIMRARNEIALSRGISDEHERAVLEDNLADIDSMTSLLHTLLNLARLEGHVDRLSVVPLDPVKILKSLVEELFPLWAEKGLVFKWVLPPTTKKMDSTCSLLIFADEKYLKQAFINILNNAYKYAPIGSVITVTVAGRNIEGDWFSSIVIANQGPPIPEESLDLIFKKFYRIKRQDYIVRQNARSVMEPGFGLGLSICRTLIELQNGTVKAFNPVDGGAAFEILLPLS
jgi:signal transduction histidine kinase